jgi:hypothetical protein
MNDDLERVENKAILASMTSAVSLKLPLLPTQISLSSSETLTDVMLLGLFGNPGLPDEVTGCPIFWSSDFSSWRR